MGDRFLTKVSQTVFLAISLLAFGAVAANAQKGTSVVKRVKFAAGKSTAVVSGSVRRGVSNDYLVAARAGQDASFHLEASSGVTFTLMSPNGEDLADFETSWMGTLPASGTYRINVLPDTETNRAKSYKLTIRISN